MNSFPSELLSHIGSFLNQENQLKCTKVYDKQVASYLKEDPSLRRLTTSCDFGTGDLAKEFEQVAKSTSHLKALRLYYFESETMGAPKIASIIQQHWSTHLVKIELGDDLLKEVIPFLSHQLQDVKGCFESFFDASGNLIPMPQLTALDIFNGRAEVFDSNEITTERLNDMRIAYPLLENLTLDTIHLDYLENDNKVYTPFPFVQSLYIDCCSDESDCLAQWKTMFSNLKVLYVSDTFSSDDVIMGRVDPYDEFITANPNIVDLSIDYCGGMSQREGFPALQKLASLTKIELRGNQSTGVITRKELLDFDLLISSIPNATWLRVTGFFYIRKEKSLDSCSSGTVGYNETTSSINYQLYSNNGSVATRNSFDFYGDGEELHKSMDTITTVKKKMPQLKQIEPIPIYTWSEGKPSYHILNSLIVSTTYSLTTLFLEKVTLRNPTYKWIAQHLPLLKNFHVNDTEPYPFCEIILGENIKSFLIAFDKRYTKYGTPIIHLINDNLQNERTVAWISEQKLFKEMQKLEELGLSTYAIIIRFKPIPKGCTVCDAGDISSLMHEMNG